MLRKTLATMAMAALAVPAPGAYADAPQASCGLTGLQHDAVSDKYSAVLYGYAVHAGGGAVGLHCYVRINSIASTGGVSNVGTGATVAAGTDAWEADEGAYVELCTEVTAHSATTESCTYVTDAQVPPQEIIDLVCLVTQLLAPINIRDLLVVDSTGTVNVAGTAVWPCRGPDGASVDVVTYLPL